MQIPKQQIMDVLRDQNQQGDSSKADQADLHDEMDRRDPPARREVASRRTC